jgi:hypothetical protein
MAIPAKRYLELDADSELVRSPEFPRIEEIFYTSLRTANGSWKTTRHHRLDQIDDVFFQVLSKSQSAPSVAMDIGISSGITTLEWLAKFEAKGLRVKMYGTDVAMTVYVVTLGRGFRALIDPAGTILQVELFGRGIRLWCGLRDYLNGTFIFRRMVAALAAHRLDAIGISFSIGALPDRLKPLVAGPHRLVSPQLKGRPDIVLIEDDILSKNTPEVAGVADVIRVANVLQHNYFSPQQIETAVRNIKERCRGEGSWVVICREKEAKLEGSILRLIGGRFVAEARLGAGSEVEQYFTG